MSDESLKKLLSGQVDVPGLFTGNLHCGLDALAAALEKKLAYTVTPKALASKILVGGKLKLPGIACVEQTDTLDIGPITKVEAGGILLTRGPIRIKGDIVRGSTTEPLTLVSLDGGITIDASVKSVEAHLVALGARGKLTLPPGPLTVTGGLAARELDLPGLLGGTAPRIVRYVEDMDPLGPNRDPALRVFYGTDARICVDGGGL